MLELRKEEENVWNNYSGKHQKRSMEWRNLDDENEKSWQEEKEAERLSQSGENQTKRNISPTCIILRKWFSDINKLGFEAISRRSQEENEKWERIYIFDIDVCDAEQNLQRK